MGNYDDYAVASFDSIKKMSDEYNQKVDILAEDQIKENTQTNTPAENINKEISNGKNASKKDDIIKTRTKKMNDTFNILLFALMISSLNAR